jgi:hypothetical protein
MLLAIAAQAGEPLDFRPAVLEELVVSSADAQRAGGGWLATPGKRTETERVPLVELDGTYRRSEPDEPEHAELLVGPSDVGSFVRFTPDPQRMRIGASIAPRVARALELSDALCGTRIGPLDAAREAE